MKGGLGDSVLSSRYLEFAVRATVIVLLVLFFCSLTSKVLFLYLSFCFEADDTRDAPSFIAHKSRFQFAKFVYEVLTTLFCKVYLVG